MKTARMTTVRMHRLANRHRTEGRPEDVTLRKGLEPQDVRTRPVEQREIALMPSNPHPALRAQRQRLPDASVETYRNRQGHSRTALRWTI